MKQSLETLGVSVKHLLLTAVLALSFSALADTDARTPTGDKVQMEVVMDADSCVYSKDGQLLSCQGVTEKERIRFEVTGELIHSECRPACKYNDSVQFSGQNYVLNQKVNGQALSIDYSVDVTRMALFDEEAPSFDVELAVSPSDSNDDEDERSALTSAKDLASLSYLGVPGKGFRIENPDGSHTKITPHVALLKFKFLPKPTSK